MHDIAEFLGGHDPFRELDEGELNRLAQRVEVEFFPAGTTIVPQGKPFPGKVRVVRRGSVELVDRGRVVDLLGEGELFGHPSMLSGRPTEFEARAHEDSLCYAISALDVVPLLARPSSLPYLARSLLRRRRPGAADESDVASAETAQQPARSLIRRRPVICAPDDTVREAATKMAEEGIGAILVRSDDRGELGILTDSDLRSRVVADGLSADAPVAEAMTAPLVTVAADATGADVMLAMLDNDIRHVPVLSPGGDVLGVIVGIDLVAAEGRTPFVLRRAIARARSKEELRDAARRLRSTVIALHRAGLVAAQVSDVISVVADALIRRMIELAIESEGPAPVEFAWLSLGSHGRREAVPSSDVDSGLAWRDDSEPAAGPPAARRVLGSGQVGRYMQAIADDVNDCIRVIGWRLDPHGVTAAGRFSASSIADWRHAIREWLSHPDDEPVLIATSILLDGRTVYGPEHGLDPKVFLYEPENRFRLLGSMLRLALASKPPTGFLRDIVVEDSGEHRGTLDIKHGGLLPVVDLARYAGLKAGAELTSTVERLRIGGEAGVIEAAHAGTLAEAFELFEALRLEHQVQRLEEGLEPDDHLDPAGFTPLTRRHLRDAFREVAAVQRTLARGLSRRW